MFVKIKTLFFFHLDSLLLFLLPFFLYTYTAPPSVFTGDSGDITNAAALFGYAHPPGYPLHSFLGYLWIHLFQFGTIAWRMNIFSAVWGALAIVVCYHIIRKVTGGNIMAGMVGAFCLATAYAFWEFSIVAEVFSLHVLLSLLFMAGIIWWGQTKDIRYAYLAVAAFALEIAHHHTIVLWLPGALVWLLVSGHWKRITPRFIFWSALICFGGLALYVYVPISYYLAGRYFWGDPTSIQGLLDIFLRRVYGTFNIAADGSALSLTQRLRYIPVYGIFTLFNFSVWGGLLALLGFVQMYKQHRVILYLVVINVLISGIGFLMFAGLPITGLFNLGAMEKFSVMSLSLVAISIGCGVHGLQQIVREPQRKQLIGLIALLIPLYVGINHWPVLNLRNYWDGWYLGIDTLYNLRQPAVVRVAGDSQVFNTRYVYEVEGYRTEDVLLSMAPFELTYQQLDQHIVAAGLDVTTPPQDPAFFGEFIEKYNHTYNFYSRNRLQLPPDKELIPEGMTFRLYDVEDIPERAVLIRQITQFLDNALLLQSDYHKKVPAYAATVRDSYSFSLDKIGDFYFALDELERAQEVFELALVLNDRNTNATIGMSALQSVAGDCVSADRLLTDAQDRYAEPIPELWRSRYRVAQHCYQDEQKMAELANKYHELFGVEL